MLNRPRELHLLIDYMLSAWPEHGAIDGQEIGAFGFSSGGFTVLAAAGGKPNLALVGPHCTAHPTYFDCTLIAAHPTPAHATEATAHDSPYDSRIKAIVVVAPALGFTFVDGLSAVTQPVQLWRADDDHILPAPEYADAVRRALPNPPEFHGVPGADHFDFLAPCSPQLAQVAPQICISRPGFDRAAFHEHFNASIVRFFLAHLQWPPTHEKILHE